MYDELIKVLRGCVLSKPCDGCPYYDPNGPTEKCATLNLAAADAIEELQAQIDGWIKHERNALLKSIPKWIPVTERLPKENGDYLVHTVGGNFNQLSATEMAFWDNDKFIVESFLDVTHWMPLPEPPESEDE